MERAGANSSLVSFFEHWLASFDDAHEGREHCAGGCGQDNERAEEILLKETRLSSDRRVSESW